MTPTARPASPATTVRPVLKWAGGKRQLLPSLRPYYPQHFTRYFEPFVGSGAVFLDLLNTGRTRGHEVRLSDINADIIGCYRAIRDNVEDVIDALWVLDAGHRACAKEHFYEVRDGRFNPARRAVHSRPQPEAAYTPDLAAMLIYLNRTGYNGLFRLNSHGAFNVPAGRYGSVRICDPDNLRRLSSALRDPAVSIEVQPFEAALASVAARDFVYLDPPYAPLSRTANFTSYTSGGFNVEQQTVLQSLVIELAGRGAHVLLSNSCAPDVSALYERSAAACNAGLRTRTVEARRAINSRGSSRGPVLEYLITNVPRGAA